MAIALVLMFIIFIFLVFSALFTIGIIFIVFGAEDKKKGGSGKKKTIGIVMVAIPIFIIACIGGKTLLDKVRIKCVADEWRYRPVFMPRNSITCSQDMLRSMLKSIDEKDEDKIYREFSANVNADSFYEDNVDDIEKQGVSLDPDDFLTDYGKKVQLDIPNTVGYIYSADIDGETYYCYLRICYSSGSGDKNDVGLQQFIVCTKDKEDELYKIIENGDDDTYLEVL